MNVLLFIVSILIFLSAVIFLYKLFGKSGIYMYIAFATILANIAASKSITLFGLTTTAGSILYASSFLSTDILSEKYGKKVASKAVFMGIIITVLWMIGTQITVMFTPSASDFINESLKDVFGVVPRICIASLVGYTVSQFIDVILYHTLWKKSGYSSKKLWLRNNVSTLTSQLIDTVIFATIAFLGTVPFNIYIEIMLTTYLFKAIVALCDTPFAYLARKIKPMEEENE